MPTVKVSKFFSVKSISQLFCNLFLFLFLAKKYRRTKNYKTSSTFLCKRIFRIKNTLNNFINVININFNKSFIYLKQSLLTQRKLNWLNLNFSLNKRFFFYTKKNEFNSNINFP